MTWGTRSGQGTVSASSVMEPWLCALVDAFFYWPVILNARSQRQQRFLQWFFFFGVIVRTVTPTFIFWFAGLFWLWQDDPIYCPLVKIASCWRSLNWCSNWSFSSQSCQCLNKIKPANFVCKSPSPHFPVQLEACRDITMIYKVFYKYVVVWEGKSRICLLL